MFLDALLAYVLDKRISESHKIPKWIPWSRCSIFMGLSPRHASTVPLVLNFDTGAITPQFHDVLDNWFATIATEVNDLLPDFTSESWASLFGESVFQFMIPDDKPAEDDLSNPTYYHITSSDDTALGHIDQVTPAAVPLSVPQSTPRATPQEFSVPASAAALATTPPTTWSSPLPMASSLSPSGPRVVDSPRPFPSLTTPTHQRESTPIQRESTPSIQRESSMNQREKPPTVTLLQSCSSHHHYSYQAYQHS
jgi:hypothetical protein